MRLFKRGKIWWVTYGGKPQKRVSTGQMNRQKAEDCALRIVAPAMTDNEAALVEKEVRLRRRASEERTDCLPLVDVFSVKKYVKRHGVKESQRLPDTIGCALSNGAAKRRSKTWGA